jgi:hypothetical protein
LKCFSLTKKKERRKMVLFYLRFLRTNAATATIAITTTAATAMYISAPAFVPVFGTEEGEAVKAGGIDGEAFGVSPGNVLH